MRNNKLKVFISSLALVLFILPAVLIFAGCSGSQGTLSVRKNFKTSYTLNESLDVSGGYLDYVSKDGEELLVEVKADMVLGFSATTPGTRTMTIVYQDASLELKYTVSNFVYGDYAVSNIKTVNNLTGEFTEVPYKQHFPNLTLREISFNPDLSARIGLDLDNESSLKTINYDFDIDGEIHTISGDIKANGYFRDGKVYLIYTQNSESEVVYLVFEPIT